jgi:hypothetical protein
MPNPHRVASRYTAKRRKKRAALHRLTPTIAESLGSSQAPGVLSGPRPAADLPARQETPKPTPVERAPLVGRSRMPTRRPFSSYAQEYRYVQGDLQRVALVAGILFLFLIVLSFFIR